MHVSTLEAYQITDDKEPRIHGCKLDLVVHMRLHTGVH
jgi:hypothetical protein